MEKRRMKFLDYLKCKMSVVNTLQNKNWPFRSTISYPTSTSAAGIFCANFWEARAGREFIFPTPCFFPPRPSDWIFGRGARQLVQSEKGSREVYNYSTSMELVGFQPMAEWAALCTPPNNFAPMKPHHKN
jgi:hypothetical protein